MYGILLPRSNKTRPAGKLYCFINWTKIEHSGSGTNGERIEKPLGLIIVLFETLIAIHFVAQVFGMLYDIDKYKYKNNYK